MIIDAVEEMILNEENPIYGWKKFRLEYWDHAENCIVEGVIYIPPDKLEKYYEITDKICELLSEDEDEYNGN
jgi:hypothetical protein